MKKKNLVPVTALCVAGVLALGGCAQQGAKDKQEGDQVVLKVGDVYKRQAHSISQLPQNARRDSISGEKKEELSSISSGRCV